MTTPLVMILACFVVYHAVSRLSQMPSVIFARWRAKVLSTSIVLEISGAMTAFAEAYTGFSHHYSVPLLLAALILVPIADERLAGRTGISSRKEHA
jgi:hypothetical protein